jgi:hypothetical protein
VKHWLFKIDSSLTSERLATERGLPDMLRTDNGPGFLGEVFTQWCEKYGVFIDYIESGKPNPTAFSEWRILGGHSPAMKFRFREIRDGLFIRTD